MKRIATRLVSLVSLGLLTFGLASACASEQTAFPASSSDASAVGFGGAGGGGANGAAGATMMAGGCDPTFCPGGAMGVGNGCCLAAAGPCGVNYGMGCVAAVTPTQPHLDGG